MMNQNDLEKALRGDFDIESLTEEERTVLFQILNEYAEKGVSPLLEELWKQDYDEMPVDIDTFLEDPHYIGKSFDNGKAIFPYWRNILRTIYDKNAKYWECLSGNTAVKLLDGTIKTMHQLYLDYKENKKPFYLYSYDLDNEEYTVGVAHSVVHSGKRIVYRITLDNGEFFEATGDHLVLMRDKSWKEVKDLNVGSSLMPFNPNIDKYGYEYLYHPKDCGKTMLDYTHHMVRRWKYNYYKKSNHIHHKDFCKTNNDPRNLLYVDKDIHFDYHSRHFKNYLNENREDFSVAVSEGLKRYYSNLAEDERYDRFQHFRDYWAKFSEEERSAMLKGRSKEYMNSEEGKALAVKNLSGFNEAAKNGEEWAINIQREKALKQMSDPDAVQYSKEYRDKMSKLTTKRNLDGHSQYALKFRWADPEARIKMAENTAKRNKDPELKLKQKLGRIAKVGSYVLVNYGEINEENWKKAKKEKSKQPYPSYKSALEFMGSYDDLCELCSNYNHKVVSVDVVGYDDVYDLEVDKHHNFALSCGAVVHNCVFSGAIGVGKTTIAVIGIAYMLHRLMCLRSPQSYYGLSPNSKIVIAFFNITLDLSRGVAFNDLQGILLNSPWFLERGAIHGTKHKVYVPNKNIEFRVGSQERHGLGQNVFCLFKGSEVFTVDGVYDIEKLVEKDIYVYSYDTEGNVVVSDRCSAVQSGICKEMIEIEFENGVIMKCTPEHLWMVKNDGGFEYYSSAKNLKAGDDIVSINPNGGGGIS